MKKVIQYDTEAPTGPNKIIAKYVIGIFNNPIEIVTTACIYVF